MRLLVGCEWVKLLVVKLCVLSKVMVSVLFIVSEVVVLEVGVSVSG